MLGSKGWRAQLSSVSKQSSKHASACAAFGICTLTSTPTLLLLLLLGSFYQDGVSQNMLRR
jgi:hypothetical protein